MKTVFILVAGAAAGYLIWDYCNKNKKPCPCQHKEEEVTTAIVAIAPKQEIVSDSVVEVYDASRNATLPTPQRLIVGAGSTEWN
jgi:hypothetical protein